MPKGTVLWVDNDSGRLKPWVTTLQQAGYNVDIVVRPLEAEERIRHGRYVLVILDIMMDTRTVEEEREYPPEQTDRGRKLGLLLFKKMNSVLTQRNLPVLVLTNRLDREIMDMFLQAGLPADAYETKLGLRDVKTFVRKVDLLIALGRPDGSGTSEVEAQMP